MNHQPPVDLNLSSHGQGCVTDLYQLTMMAGYDAAGMSEDHAVFEVFVRKLPAHRSYLIFAGLEQAIGTLRSLSFDRDQVAEIRQWPVFAAVDPEWFERLLTWRFTGNLWAVPEGTVVFPNEPLVRIEAPLPQAQLVETMLLASLGYPTLVASKAARIVAAAQGRGVIDFGARRGHGIQASFLAARAAYIAGFLGTSQVEAARRLGIPAIGTMAHAWVQAFPDETAAFRAFAHQFPHSTLLIDTYETRAGAQRAAAIEPPIRAVRIDSGDLLAESIQAREILDDADRKSVEIVASGDLDENSIAALVAARAPINQFGVGTELITSGGAPAISMVYKLVESNGVGRIKKSPGKRTYPLAKQIRREFDQTGNMTSDHVLRADHADPADSLLVQYLAAGNLVRTLPELKSIQAYCAAQVRQLPDHLLTFDEVGDYRISYSDELEIAAKQLGL